MTKLLNAAMQEMELLQMENEDLQTVVDDSEIAEVSRMSADMRLTLNNTSIDTLQCIIRRQLEQMPVDELLSDIENNLSDQRN